MPFLRWKKCLSDPKQLLKLIAVIICICIAMYQLSGCIKKIYNPPVSTHYSFDLNQTLSYPALTICRYPAYKTSVLEKYGMTSNDPKYHTAWRNFNYENYTLNEFFEDATYSFSEILPFYGFDSFDTNIIVESSFLLTHGRCFTLTPKNETTDWFSGGYFLYFTHTDTVRMLSESGVSLSGFNIYIHDRRDLFTGGVENFESLIDYMYIEAGEEMRLNLKIHVYDQLPTAHHKCNNSRTYSQSKCIKECLNKKVTEAIGCSTPWLINDDLKSCNSYPEMYTIIKNQTSLSTQFVNQCDCPLPCYLTVYTPYIQNRKDIALPYSQISITFSSNLITSMTEVIGYDWNIFLSDLGGSLGFLLGLSVLGAIAALEQIVQAVMTKKNGNENIRKEENNVKEQNNYKSDVQISLNDKKLIEEIMGIRQSSKRIEYFLDSNFYDSHKDKDNFIQNKY